MKSRIRVSGFFNLPHYLKIVSGGIIILVELFIFSDLIRSFRNGVFTVGDYFTFFINIIVFAIGIKLLLDGLTPAFLELNDKSILFKKYSFLPVKKVSYIHINRVYETNNSVNLEIKGRRKVVFPLETFNEKNKDKISAFVTIANQKISFYNA